MSYSLFKAVNFGPGKAGLTTVGYTLTGGSRITAGVAEIGVLTGIYGATITFESTFIGSVLWDSGEGADTVYAVEEIDPRVVVSPTPTPTPTTCPDTSNAAISAVLTAATGPRRVSGDAGTVEQHSLPDLIAAAKFTSSVCAGSGVRRGLRFTKLIPDGTTGDVSSCSCPSGFNRLC